MEDVLGVSMWRQPVDVIWRPDPRGYAVHPIGRYGRRLPRIARVGSWTLAQPRFRVERRTGIAAVPFVRGCWLGPERVETLTEVAVFDDAWTTSTGHLLAATVASGTVVGGQPRIAVVR